jgi:hypothetical protein
MSKILFYFLVLLYSPFILSDDEDFSYSYLSLSYSGGDLEGPKVEASLGLPFSSYIRASLHNPENEVLDSDFKKEIKSLRLGMHLSIADVLNNVSFKGLVFDITRFLDVYAELGPNDWQISSPNGSKDSGTGALLTAGIRIGDTDSWEADIYVINTKEVNIKLNPINTDETYIFSDETENSFGINLIRNYSKHTSFTFGFSNQGALGDSYSLGLRFKL